MSDRWEVVFRRADNVHEPVYFEGGFEPFAVTINPATDPLAPVYYRVWARRKIRDVRDPMQG